ncbi:MAG: DUF433 domain-containing protein [Acidobacteria bacterium]|nr:DUF433 domain-containing protein [Acidobacteriota bacterium]
MKRTTKRREFGKYIVADPEICHGQLTFKGTRIFVKHVLEQVAAGMDWDAIVADWDGAVTKEAIAEAIHVASQVLVRHVEGRRRHAA